MMKKFKPIYLLLFANVIFVACNNERTNDSKYEQLTVDRSDEFQATDKTIDSTTVSTENISTDNCNNVEKPLPQIDSITYLPLNTDFDFNFKDYKALQELDSFKIQLPNVGKFEVYVLSLNEQNAPEAMKQSFVALSCTFILVYNPSNKHAQIVNIKNDFYIDAAINMTYQLDENGIFSTTETMTTDGDYGENGEMLSTITDTISQHLIEIKKDGTILIKNKN